MKTGVAVIAALSGAYFASGLVALLLGVGIARSYLVIYILVGLIGLAGSVAGLLRRMGPWRAASILALGASTPILISSWIVLVSPAPLHLRLAIYLQYPE